MLISLNNLGSPSSKLEIFGFLNAGNPRRSQKTTSPNQLTIFGREYTVVLAEKNSRRMTKQRRTKDLLLACKFPLLPYI